MKIAVIDGDSIGYTIGWIKKDIDPNDIMSTIVAVDAYMEKILVATGATHLIGFLGGVQPTFRDLSSNVGEVFGVKMKGYKEDRGIGKPAWYYQTFYLITHRLRTKYGFQNIEFIEADDAVIITANYFIQQGEDVVLCHCDKDLKQFPGVHYDYKKDEKFLITEEEASYNFWKQMIMGDSTDTVEGIPGLGEKKADKFLQGTTPAFFKNHVLTLYQTKFGERNGLLKFAITYNYLCMLKEPAYNFDVENIIPFPAHGLVDPKAVPRKTDLKEVFGQNFKDNE